MIESRFALLVQLVLFLLVVLFVVIALPLAAPS